MLDAGRFKRFLRQHDFVCDAPATIWNQGLPLGNGEIGVVLWGEGNPLILTLDKYDLWEPRQKEYDFSVFNYRNLRRLHAERKMGELNRIFEHDWRWNYAHLGVPTRIPPGRLELDFGEAAIGFEARLSLYDACAKGKVRLEGGGEARFRTFVCATRDVVVAEVRLSGGASLMEARHRASKADYSYLGYPPNEFGEERGVRWRLERMAEGREYAVAWSERRNRRGDRAVVYATIVMSNQPGRAAAAAVGRIREAQRAGAGRLYREHAAWWADFWSRSFLTVPEPRLEGLYYAEIYQVGSLARAGHSAITGEGIWAPDDRMPPWSNEYTFDLNEQLTCWPCYTSNHLENARPMLEQVWSWMPWLREFCRGFIGCEGAFLTSATTNEGKMVPGWPAANLWLGNGPWAAHHYWLHYLYSQDREFLRARAYPVMKEFMRMYLGVLEEDKDGRLHIPLSSSPETGEPGPEGTPWGADTSCDLALCRFLAETLLKVTQILGLEDPEASRWQEVLDRLAPYQADERVGLHVWKGLPLGVSHRHHTHLLAIHPLGLITIEGGEQERKLIEASLRNLIAHGTGAWCGYSFAWASLLASRAGWANLAEAMLTRFMQAFVRENSLHVNGDYKNKGCGMGGEVMTPEGGQAAAAAVLEMLLQSWNGVVRVFPAVPDYWPDAGFWRLRAEGAFLVSARREAGETKWVKIESEVGGGCRVRNPFRGAVALKDEKNGTARVLTGEILEFATEPGERYLLAAEGAPPQELSIPLPRWRRRESNWFGVQVPPRF
jgi:alpha-L-fucosidase 2